MIEHFKPYPIDDECWNGEKPHCKGSDWRLEDGTIQTGKRYDCWFGGGETIIINEQEIIVKGEIKIQSNDTLFIFYGLNSPWILISSIPKNIYLKSEQNNPSLLAQEIRKAMKTEPFQSHFGKLFLARVPEVLNYSFEKDVLNHA